MGCKCNFANAQCLKDAIIMKIVKHLAYRWLSLFDSHPDAKIVNANNAIDVEERFHNLSVVKILWRRLH